MGLDGNVQQLTHFSDQNARVSIHTPLWSPDGRFLAFWVQVSRARLATVREMTWRLVVLDVAAQKATNLCIDFSIPEFSPSVERPVWSPDSNHLAIQVIDGDNRKNRALLIVDLLAHTYTQVPTSENPIGWLQNSQ
jgi:Tol biopolymer transport system component